MWQRVMFPVGMLALALLLIGGGVERGGWLLPVSVLVATAGMAGAYRGWALRVETQPHGIVVVNWFRVIRLWWPQIDRFGADDEGLFVRKTDGAEVRVAAFQHGSRAFAFARSPAVTAAAELERLREDHQ